MELPPGEELTAAGRVSEEAASFQGMVEGQQEDITIAASVNQLDKGRVLLRCLNLADQPVKLAAETVVGEWHRVNQEDVQELRLGCKNTERSLYLMKP